MSEVTGAATQPKSLRSSAVFETNFCSWSLEHLKHLRPETCVYCLFTIIISRSDQVIATKSRSSSNQPVKAAANTEQLKRIASHMGYGHSVQDIQDANVLHSCFINYGYDWNPRPSSIKTKSIKSWVMLKDSQWTDKDIFSVPKQTISSYQQIIR